MVKYTGIKGYKIRSLASDPSPVSEGQLWYDTATDDLKYTGPGSGSWSAGGDMANNRRLCATGGTQTDTYAGGSGPPHGTACEEYNGSTWGTGGALPTGMSANSGAGTTSAGLSFGGYAPSPPTNPGSRLCFEYNGIAWTDGGLVNTARAAGSGCGTQAAALYAGGQGFDTPTASPVSSEEYNGAAWTYTNPLTWSAQLGYACGTTGAALAAGYSPASPTQTATYDGTSWSQVSPGAFAQDSYGSAIWGTAASCLKAGGLPPSMTLTCDAWNGTTWSASTSKSVAQASGNATGTTTLGLYFGGYDPANAPNYDVNSIKTEEWSQPTLSTKTVTVS